MTARWPVVLAALLSASCLGAESGATSNGRDVVIGVPIALTGADGPAGLLTRQGLDLWLRRVADRGGIDVAGVRHRVVLRYADDQSRPERSAELTQQLITEGAEFLLGPFGTLETSADAPVADRDGVIMVESGGPAQSIFSHGYRSVFCIASPANKYLQGVLDMAATLNPKPTSIELLSADDSFSQEVADAVVAYAPIKGFQVVAHDVYPTGTIQFGDYLAHARALNADMLLDAGHLQEAINLHRAAQQLGLDARLFAYTVGPATPAFVGSLGRGADYVFTGSQWTTQVRYAPSFGPTTAEYVAAYRRLYRTTSEPEYHVAQGTAAGLTLQKAIENAGSLDPDEVRYRLEALNVTTFYGQIKFDSRGMNIYKPMVVQQIQDGRQRTVWPPDLADSRPRYPTPSWASRG